MLVLKIVDEPVIVTQRKSLFRKKNAIETPNIKRENLKIGSKNIVLLELPLSEFNNTDVKQLMNVFKGRILITPQNKISFADTSYLFDSRCYYSKALLSSLAKQISFNKKDIKSVCLKYDDFEITDELFDVAKTTRNLTVIAKNSKLTDKFKNECFDKFGAYISFSEKELSAGLFDVYADFSKTDNDGQIIIKEKGIEKRFYPDTKYFIPNDNTKILTDIGINEKTACACIGTLWK